MGCFPFRDFFQKPFSGHIRTSIGSVPFQEPFSLYSYIKSGRSHCIPIKIKDIRGKMRIWGWGTFPVNIIKRIAEQLRRIILLNFGLLTFRFHYERTRVHDSQHQYCLSLETPGYINETKGNPPTTFAPNIILEVATLWKSCSSKILEKTGTDKSRRSV